MELLHLPDCFSYIVLHICISYKKYLFTEHFLWIITFICPEICDIDMSTVNII